MKRKIIVLAVLALLLVSTAGNAAAVGTGAKTQLALVS